MTENDRIASAFSPLSMGEGRNNPKGHASSPKATENVPDVLEKAPNLAVDSNSKSQTNGKNQTNGTRVSNKKREKSKKNLSSKSRSSKGLSNYNRKPSPIYAALDLGTNNCRLLVARQQGNGFRVIDGYSKIVRLGEGVSISGQLDENAIKRTIAALADCKVKLDRHQPKYMRLIATQACRGADNSDEFLQRVKDETGIELEIIDQRVETQLAVAGCGDLIDENAHGALMFDIGGGSTELAWLDFRGGRPKLRSKMPASIRSWHSLPVGVVSIAEKFGGKHVNNEIFEEMVAYVTEKLKAFKGRKKLQDMIKTHNVHLIGTSGTVTTLGGLHLGLERYDRSKVDGLWMRNDEVVDTMRVLLNMTYERRAENSCIGEDRSDLVIPGCAIFEAIRREWTTKNIRVADRGLREGMLVSMLEQSRQTAAQKRSSKAKKNKRGEKHG